MFSSRLLVPLFLIAAVAACVVVLVHNSITMLLLFGLTPVVLLFCGKPQWIAMGSIILFFSSIKLIGLPGQRQLHELFMSAFFAICVLHSLIDRRNLLNSWPKKWAFLFICVVGMVMALRGFGFQSLGGEKWGGGRYLSLIPCILFFIVSGFIEFSSAQWRKYLSLMLLMSLLPGVAEIVYRFGGKDIAWQFLVITPTASVENAYTESSMRISGFFVASMVFLFPFINYPFSNRYFGRYSIFMALGIVFVGVTGHRLGLVYIAMFIWLYCFIRSQRRISYFIVSMVVGVAVCAFLAMVAGYLPVNFQRTLSIIPFANVLDGARMDASATSTWRIMLWKEALHEIPTYLWLGKGFAYDAETFIAAMRASATSEYNNLVWALVSASYHQGILSLLIGLGLPGLITGLGFMTTVSIGNLKFARHTWGDPESGRIHFVLTVWFVVSTAVYIFVYGDVTASFPNMFFFAALIEAQKAQEMRRLAAPTVSGP